MADRDPSGATPGGLGEAPLGTRAVEIAVVSCVVLFQELTLIRWLPGQVRVLAYFPNLILIAAFLGLGLGCLRAGHRSLLWLWPTSLVVVVAAAGVLSRVVFAQDVASDHLWLFYLDLGPDAPVVESIRLPIVLFFLLSLVTFVPLGQFLAERIDVFRVRSSALWGYSLDLLGSLAGVIAFAAVSFLGLLPWTWFAATLVLGWLFFRAGRPGRWLFLPVIAGVPLLVQVTDRAQLYSPYYAISVDQASPPGGFTVLTNGSLHQQAHPLRRSDPIDTRWGLELREGYHFPYRQLRRPLGRVLVLGAGTGNDVAVLLDEGAEQVDAVEIDPVILALGDRHPNRPYSSPRVRRLNTDARSYLNGTAEEYDLIVFGTLDSQTRLSALSNVRLDNFVYTRECLRAARNHLTEDGGMVLYFMVFKPYIDQRLFGLLASTFGHPPVVRTRHSSLFNRIFMCGPAFDHLRVGRDAAQRRYGSDLPPPTEIPTDDWPYLYLRHRSVSPFYLGLIALFALVATASVLLASGEMRDSLRGGLGVDLEMFLFGAGFLLIETKLVTGMSLVWGATWITSAVVFGSVLLMILVSTVLMEVSPLRWRPCVLGLMASLLLTSVLPVRLLLLESPLPRLAASVLYAGAPVFFAAACFAIRFRQRRRAGVALGWNLLGAVTGGLLEFLAMVIGIRALSMVAMAIYLGAVLAGRAGREATGATASVG